MPPLDVVLTGHWSDLEPLGDGLGCTWLAGRVALQPSSAFLLTEALPDMVHVRASQPGAESLRSLVEEIIAFRAFLRWCSDNTYGGMRTKIGRPLAIAVVGVGGIGSMLGFELARAGHDVTLVARPGSPRLAQLQREGGIVRTTGERVEASVADALDEQKPWDLVP